VAPTLAAAPARPLPFATLRRSFGRKPGVLLAAAYALAVTAVTVTHFTLDLPSADAITLTPSLFAQGKLWLLATSAFLVSSDSLAGAWLSLGVLAAAIASVRDPGRFWRAAIAGHVGSTVIVYAGVGMVWAADPHAVAGLVDQSDYGISCVCAGAAGALFATTSHHRSQALRLLYPALLVGWLVGVSATSGGLALLEHPIAFVLGWAVAIRRPWSGNARHFGRRAVLVLTLALALFVGVSAPAGAATSALRGTMADSSYSSAALKGTIHFEIYLPPDYATSGKRYPVIYFLHGLPAAATDYRQITEVAAAVEASGQEAIVIGVQGARAGDTDPEWRNWGAGRNWETATAKELVRVVDTRYHSIASQAGRLLIGISAGGYGATLIALHNPDVYAVVESWSGYFHATNPAGTAALELGSVDADDWASAHKQIARAKRFLSASGTRTYFAFYVGTGDPLFRTENEEFYLELKEAGLTGIVFRLYAGGHSWTLWSAHATPWLAKGLSVAAQPYRAA
jgi:enterochelin esterase-like enzyme